MSVIKMLGALQGTAAKGRATLIGLTDIPERASAILTVIKQFLKIDLIVSAPIASAIIGILFVLMMALLLIKGKGPWRFAVLPISACLILFSSVGVISVGHDFRPVPRTLVAIALVPAFAFCILQLLSRSKWAHRLLFVSASLILISFTGIGTLVAADQVRINKRDALFASSVAARLSLSPGTRLAIVGGPDNAYGLQTVRGDLNISAYWADWSKTQAISENLGYQIQTPTEDDWVRSRKYCAAPEVKIWPATDSTMDLGTGLTVICLSKP